MTDRLLPASEEKMGFVYAIKCEGFVKIGWSQTVQRRYNQISANNPHKITLLGSAPGAMSDEGLIQMLLERPYKQKGEWFRYEGLVVEVVENLIHSGDANYTAEWLSKRLADNRRPRTDIKSHGKRPPKLRSPDAPELDLTTGADALADWGHND